MCAVDPDDDQGDPRHPQGGDLLPKQDHGENRDEQGTRPSGERIDQRKVAPLVGAPHAPEVDPVDEAGGNDAVPPLSRDGTLRDEVQEPREIDDSAYQEEPPDEGDLPVALLEQVVPARMEKRGRQDDAHGYAAHRPFTLFATPDGSSFMPIRPHRPQYTKTPLPSPREVRGRRFVRNIVWIAASVKS